MVLSIVAVIIGLAVLVWSADKFVEEPPPLSFRHGAISYRHGDYRFWHLAPEMVVSALPLLMATLHWRLVTPMAQTLRTSLGIRYHRCLSADCGQISGHSSRNAGTYWYHLLSAIFLLDYQITRFEAAAVTRFLCLHGVVRLDWLEKQ